MKNLATGLSIRGCDALLQWCPGSLGLGVLGGCQGCTWWLYLVELVLDVQESPNELEVCQCEWQVLVVTHCKEQHEETDSC